MKALALSSFLAFLFAPSLLFEAGQARADDTSEAPLAPKAALPSGSGLAFGLRGGWAAPLGHLQQGESLGSSFDGMVPVWLDAGYRLSHDVYVGGYFQWAPLFVNGDLCPEPLRCSATDLRFGINLHWHFGDLLRSLDWPVDIDPWLGLGAGYEIATTHLSVNGANAHETDAGFELVNVQLGADYMLAPSFRLGAFSTLAVAEFTKITVSVPTGSSTHDVGDPAVHLWLMFGVRGQYDL